MPRRIATVLVLLVLAVGARGDDPLSTADLVRFLRAGISERIILAELRDRGFGVDLVSGDYSQGAVGHWIEKGRLVHPVHEVTIAGNLQQMLLDVDAMGSDLVWRSSSAAPTLRIRRMTVSGS